MLGRFFCVTVSAPYDNKFGYSVESTENNNDTFKLKEIVARAKEDLETLSKEDRAFLLKTLQEHRSRQASGYRVVSKAQQQDVLRMAQRFEQEVMFLPITMIIVNEVFVTSVGR
jgi:maltooligosyltrehalose synthase